MAVVNNLAKRTRKTSALLLCGTDCDVNLPLKFPDVAISRFLGRGGVLLDAIAQRFVSGRSSYAVHWVYG